MRDLFEEIAELSAYGYEESFLDQYLTDYEGLEMGDEEGKEAI
jgi:hypothetical protein